jgi:gliding motility-associated-like protein
MQSLKSINYLILVALLFFFSKNPNAQTSLEGGDLAVVGVNANNFACSGQNGEDIISIVCFKDITVGTTIDLTDNGWERLNANQFGDSEGTIRATYAGGTIPAGQVITFVANNSGSYSVITHTGWTFVSLNDPPGLFTSLNLNANGDQLFFMQGGFWDWGNPASGTHDATYDGKILFGFNTKPNWDAFADDSNDSGLHPEVIPCFHMEPSSGQSDYLKYTGPMTAVTQVEWITLISDASNWTSYPSCSVYNSASPDYTGVVNFPIAPSGMSIDCTTCNANCPGFQEILTFNLPTSGGPFNVVYTDGTSNFTLNGISSGHTESLIIDQSTTFSLVSVTALNGCPIYSNFDGEAVVIISGSGGGSAVLSGGGVLCTDNCTLVTVTITGGTAPYIVGAVVNFPPLVNNFPISTPATVTNFEINICSQGLFPIYDISTNTLSLPSFVTGNLSFALTGITDNSGCVGTVDPTPLAMTIEQTPTANAAGPMSECDEGGNTATFDLTSLNSTVNGGNSNTVAWYEDMALSTTISNASNYSTTSTTVYATTSTVDCESEPVAVQLIVDPSPAVNAASLTDCTPTGIATFDLTSLNSTVNGGTGLAVTWFTNSAGTNPIFNPSNYITGSELVYAVVTNSGCTSLPAIIILTVNIAPTGVSTIMTVCESAAIPTFGDFDLSTLNSTVNGGTGLPVAWFTNTSATNPILGSFITAQNNTVVYAVVGTAPCTSTVTSVTLFVTPFPPAVSTILEECATFGNQAIFDLTSVDNIINAGSGASVTWFEDIGGMNQIVLPGSYLSASIFVYVQTSNGFCTSPIQPVELIVTPEITANMTSATACDEGNGVATFDLDVLGLNINSDPGNTVNWYFDSNAAIPISSPYITVSTIVYAQVTNGICESQIVSIGLAIDIAPTANITSATVCDSGNGSADFDLNVIGLDVNSDPGNTVNWFLDENATLPIASPHNTGSTIIYAEVTNGNCNSPITPISLNVEAVPMANNTSAAVCDLGNGTGDFDLTLIENDVNSTSGNTISWYSDVATTNPISSPYNTVSTIIYAIVSNENCNSNPAEIILTVEAAPVGNTAMSDACDIGNGTADFDLDAIAMTVNTNSAYTVSWFLYANGTNPILVTLFNTSTTFVYAVVANGAGCESVPVQVDLNVITTPTANTASAAACEVSNGTANFDLIALENTVNGSSANTVSWYSDLAGTNSISSPYNTGSTIVYAIVSGTFCNSQPVAVDLTVNSVPTANSTDAAVCINDGSGIADFDLTSLENIVNGGSGSTVLWYSDAAVTNQVFSPYNSSTATIYATVTVGNCPSAPVTVDLMVGDQPTANIALAALCDSGDGTATFDLTALENTISGGTLDPINFFSDMAGTILISSPYNTASTTVYATVTVGFCPSEPVAINLTVENFPTANTASALLCDEGGGASFDLTSLESTVGSGDIVTWYADVVATNIISSPFFTSTIMVYAVVGAANCASDPVAINLIVENLPTATGTVTSLCDDGNGTATFDLTALENTVNGGSGNIVLWYSDAMATAAISSPLLTSSATIYAVVDNGSCLSNTAAIDLNIITTPSISTASATLCDEGSGMADFDLTALENTVNGGSGNTVTWYSDANGTTIIMSPFNAASTIVYAIVSNGNCVSSIEAIDLTVANFPEANPATIANCDSGNGTADFDLNAIANTVNGGNGNIVTWFLDINLTTSISSPFNSTATTIYAVVNDATCTAAAVEVTLEITNDIAANPTFLAACDDGTGAASFDLTDLNFQNNITGGNGNSIFWFVDLAATNPLSPPFNAFVTVPTSIYAVVGSGNCSSAPVEISLILSPEVPSADNLIISNCDYGDGTSSFDLDSQADIINTGNGNQVLWFEDQNMMNSIASPYVSATTTIYAIVTDGVCFSEILEVGLIVNNSLIGNPTTAFECDTNSGFAAFDLEVIASDVNSELTNTVTWYSDANATMPISSPYNTQTTTVFAIVNNGPCQSPPIAVSLEVTNSTPAFPTSDVQCDDGSGLASFDLDVLANSVNGGNGLIVNWFSDAAATSPIVTPFTSVPTTIYAMVENGNCPSSIVAITLEVSNNLPAFPTSDLQCDSGDGTADFSLDFLANSVNGGNGNTVNWFSDATAMTPIVSPFNSNSTLVYAIVTDGNCSSQIVEITLIVNNNLPAFPTSDVQCDDGNGTATFDLTSLENIVNGGNLNTVNWYSDAGATTPSATIITSGNTSVYAIVTDGNCASQIVEVTLMVDNNLTAFPTSDVQCDDGSGTATFDLATLENIVNGGNGNLVNWYSDAGATTPSATTITSGNTSVYAIVTDGNCTSQIVEVTLMVDNNLTAFPTSDAQCDDGSGTATFDLTTLENIVNGGNFNTVNWYSDAGATTPSATTIISGNTSVYAIVTDGNCTSQIVEVTLMVNNNLTAFPTSDVQCDEGSGTATFDLSTLENIVNGGNGNTVNWYSDAGATTPSATTINSGNTSVYAIITDGNCFSPVVEIDLFITSVSTNNIIQTLCDGENIMVNNMVYDASNDSGVEIISGGNINGCDSIINVDLTFEPEITGIISASTNSICPGNEVILTFNLTGGSTYDVGYSEGGNPSTVLNGIADGHTITVFPTATTIYSLESVTLLGTICIAVTPTTQITIQVEPIDVFITSIGSVGGYDIVCATGNTGAAVAVPTNGIAPFTYLWSNGATSDIASSLTAGTYEVTITDANGCAGISSITLTEPTPVDYDVIAIAPPCLDATEGQIIFDNIAGGVGNYSFSFDGSPFVEVINNTTILDLVTIGEHTIFILDGNGCGFEQLIMVPEPIELILELGDDETIALGESLELQPQTNFTASNILWSENTSCDTCFTQLVTPINETTYTLELFDENGCFVTDEITIFVEKNRNIFIPNAFSPDDNGFNDIFYINAGEDVAEVKNFRIFNRWGEVIFENEDFQPNEPTQGWDGFFNNEKLNPNVFVFFAEIEFKDGFVKIYKGDVTLTR